jgi:hypothetical protein
MTLGDRSKQPRGEHEGEGEREPRRAGDLGEDATAEHARATALSQYYAAQAATAAAPLGGTQAAAPLGGTGAKTPAKLPADAEAAMAELAGTTRSTFATTGSPPSRPLARRARC